MCDYSIHVKSRPAKVGETLKVSTFGAYYRGATRGFQADGEDNIAVCLLPGTQLVFQDHVLYEPPYLLGHNPLHEKMTATFRHINENLPHQHHDALEFAEGQIILLTYLLSNQRATILQLPVTLPITPAVTTPDRVECPELEMYTL